MFDIISFTVMHRAAFTHRLVRPLFLIGGIAGVSALIPVVLVVSEGWLGIVESVWVNGNEKSDYSVQGEIGRIAIIVLGIRIFVVVGLFYARSSAVCIKL